MPGLLQGSESGHAGFVDVRNIHNDRDGVLFLRAPFTLPVADTGALFYGAHGPVKVWVNGAVVDSRPTAANPSIPGQYRAKVQWKKGVNHDVRPVEQQGQGLGDLCCRGAKGERRATMIKKLSCQSRRIVANHESRKRIPTWLSSIERRGLPLSCRRQTFSVH